MAWTTIFLLNYRPGCPRKITKDKPREIEVLTIAVKCNQIAKYRHIKDLILVCLFVDGRCKMPWFQTQASPKYNGTYKILRHCWKVFRKLSNRHWKVRKFCCWRIAKQLWPKNRKCLVIGLWTTYSVSREYGIIVWGVATTLTTYKHLKHCIAGQRELSSICHGTHLRIRWWKSLSGTQYSIYTDSVFLRCFYNIVIEKIPKTISDLVTWRHGPYNLRGHLEAVVPRFSTSFLKNSSYFNNATNNKQFSQKARMDPIFKKLNFGSLSIQTTPKHMGNFNF